MEDWKKSFIYKLARCVLFIVSASLLQDEWVSMGVSSDGSYGVEPGLIYSFPVKINPDHTYNIVQGLAIDEFAREKMDLTMKELCEERDAALEVCQD